MITVAWLLEHLPGLSDVTALCEGGQKWVFGAVHSGDGDVVVKLVKPPVNLERVRREILAVRTVNSPRVPQILEDGVLSSATVGDVVWLRERRIMGESVRQVLQRGPLAQTEILRLGTQVLEALTDVAKARIVHRDIKPENVMRDASGDYWLLDFGIARHLDLTSLTPSIPLGGPGTLGYAPPEQYRNRKRDVDGRADLFALAVTVVECVTGKHPYRDGARDPMEVLRRIESLPLPVPSIEWDRQGSFADLVTAMGQRRVDCRPPNAAEALAWIREVQLALRA